ncbi:hypothetical protein NEOLEDRAFT_1146781 [Neolentinus lepideus HHB14362 ss-1]|uniref:Uncharacterized protein n=1 Tax=Neolentinus lepideus HHB14362 ss-1 TaxID=1314782 RepID=A0A165TWH1_9AGAM|nr:hypothetical protein NEOLEDRAFT_1146781 [Neolentinus lepideus HHB14362 ss-1]
MTQEDVLSNDGHEKITNSAIATPPIPEVNITGLKKEKEVNSYLSYGPALYCAATSSLFISSGLVELDANYIVLSLHARKATDLFLPYPAVQILKINYLSLGIVIPFSAALLPVMRNQSQKSDKQRRTKPTGS